MLTIFASMNLQAKWREKLQNNKKNNKSVTGGGKMYTRIDRI
jgi:hypothetical protein